MNSKKNSKNKNNRKGLFYHFCYDFVRVTGALPALVWLRPKIYRPFGTKTPKGAVLISSNHVSMIDPISVLITFPLRRLHCLATDKLYNTALSTAFFNQMHCIKVDKDNFTISAFHDVVSRLKDNCAVVIFPEGKINTEKSDTLLTFKSGVVLMAQKANAPILPIYIVKRQKWYQRQRIVIGDPIYLDNDGGMMPSLEQLNNATEKLRRNEFELQKYFESLPIYSKLQKNTNKQTTESKEEEHQYERKV